MWGKKIKRQSWERKKEKKYKKKIQKNTKKLKKKCRESFITFPTCFRALLNFIQLCFDKFYLKTYNILTFQMQSYLFLFF